MEASLRGRPLEGEILQLPEGYEAAVIQAVGSDGDIFREVKRVQQVTYWNYDKVLPNLIHMTQANISTLFPMPTGSLRQRSVQESAELAQAVGHPPRERGR